MPKQAVLLIHGVGEQRPMETLRSFVKSVWEEDTESQADHANGALVWSKPYLLSQNFELRRLTTAENAAGLRTDFFEFYWAHLMRGTKIAHVVSWAKALLFRSPSSVPKQLKSAYWTLLVLIGFGLYMTYLSAVAESENSLLLPFWLSTMLGLAVLPAFAAVLIGVVGDAARYLHISPANVHCRQEIRAAGVDVLNALHNENYERIIVVGHSLGSVIGYDILTHAWVGYNRDTPATKTPSHQALDNLERLAAKVEDSPNVTAKDFQEAQAEYFEEMKANGLRWRVSDFITLGSPLAHAEVLLARNHDDFDEKLQSREMPTCPPVLEESKRGGQTHRRFSYSPRNGKRVLHHAAVFGPTRWTNLFFPCRFMIWGDLIGGPLSDDLFGKSVLDVRVATRRWLGLLTHTSYWTPYLNRVRETPDHMNKHIACLRNALDLVGSRNAG